MLPEKNANDGGSKEHRMTGGSRAHMDPRMKNGKTTGSMEKFDVGALHEVGHAVGGRLGGHEWARQHPFVNWQTGMAVADWSKGLWGDDAALTARARTKAGDGAVITSQDARVYMATGIKSKTPKLPGNWQDEDLFEAALVKQYGDQPLAKYWQRHKGGKEKSSSYQFSGTDTYGNDGRVYVWLSRGGNEYSSYLQQAHEHKISWYSLASPHEWFAEQKYAHYYRTGKVADGMDRGTKQKLAELDKQEPQEQAPVGPGVASP